MKLTKETPFARVIRFKVDGKVHQIIHQPYVTSIYVAIYIDGAIAEQTGLAYKYIGTIKSKESVMKNLNDSVTDVEVHIAKLGDYMSESDIAIVNS